MRLRERRIDRIASTLLSVLSIGLYPLVFLHRLTLRKSSPPRILLVVRNSVAADYMSDIADLILESHNVDEFIVTSDKLPVPKGVLQIGVLAEVRSRHILSCLPRYWDLVIFTNHAFGLGVCFPFFVKKLYVNHGLHVGKINHVSGEDGVYGKGKVCRPFGRPYYHVMLASDEKEKYFAEATTPQLTGRVRVAGNLKAEKFLKAKTSKRRNARNALGINQDDFVVHVVSTWGRDSLLATVGVHLINQIAEYKGNAKILVSVHPRYDFLGFKRGMKRQEALNKFAEAGALQGSGSDWECFVHASDMTISDHSSVCLFHALLGHVVALVDVPSSSYMDGSAFDYLQKVALKYSDHEDLKSLLDSCRQGSGIDAVSQHELGLTNSVSAKRETRDLIEGMLSA